MLCSKGIEEDSGKLMTEVAAEVLPEAPIAVLSGPSFANEVAAGLPAALTLATADPQLGERLVTRLGRPQFRTYYSNDVIGAEVGIAQHDGTTEYRVGQRVFPDKWDEDWTQECAGGIHFMITRLEAENY